MSSRRKFLSTIGLALASAPAILAKGTGERRSRWEMIASNEPTKSPTVKPDPRSWSDSTLTVAWLGQSTILINFFGTRILTDPVFSERIGLNVAGLFTLGPRRLVYPALTIDELPPIDLLLLSHAHMDHLDIPSLEEFDRSIPVIMAKNTYDVIEDLDFKTVYELDWGKWTQLGGLRIEALEVKHFGWRYPWEQDRSRGNWDGRSYNAYLLSRNGRHIVFGGDTSYHEKFASLRQRGIIIDLAMMPIGAYDPWIFNHASPEQALAMCDHMGAERILPMHWQTFVQSEEPTVEPIERLAKASGDRPERIVLNTIGQTWAAAPPFSGEQVPAEADDRDSRLYNR